MPDSSPPSSELPPGSRLPADRTAEDGFPGSFAAAPRSPTVSRAVRISRAGGFWRVEAGGVDLFAVRPGASAAYGPWHPLGRVEPGEAFGGLAPLPATLDHLDILAVPLPGTRLADMAWDCGDGSFAAFDDWIVRLSELARLPLRPRDVAGLGAFAGSAPAPAGTTLCAARGLVWLAASGPVAAFGQQPVDAAVPLALTGRVWVRIAADCTVRAWSSADLAADGLLEAAAGRAVVEALTRLDAELDRAVEGAAAAFRGRETAARQRLKAASSHLASTLHPGSAGSGDEGTGDALLRCCIRVAARDSIVLDARGSASPRDADLDAARTIEARVERIAQAARVRMRRGTLSEAWWKGDHGSFVAVRGDRPVAVLRVGRGYRLVEADGRGERVDAAVAADLSPSVYLFYRPLPPTAINGWGLLRFALKGSVRELAVILAAASAAALLALITPVVSGAIFDTIVPRGQYAQLGQVTVVLAGAAIATLGFGIAQALSQLRVQGRLDAVVQSAVWDRLLNLPVSFFRDYEVGDLTSRAMGINSLSSQLTGATMSSLFGGVFSVVSFGMMLYYQWKLALIGFLFAAVTVGGSAVFALVQRSQQREQLALRGQMSARVFQYISGIAKIRSAGAESFAFWDWAGRFARDIGFQRRSGTIVYSQTLFGTFMLLAFQVLSLMMFAFFLDKISMGSFVAFNSAFGQFFSGMSSLAGAAVTVYGLAPLYERTRPILQAVPEIDGAKLDPGELSGRITLDHVSFAYPASERGGTGRPILDDVNLRIEPGEFVAVVGASGAGKSTLLRLLLGFERPVQGSVSFDGRDLATLDPGAVRRQLGVVLQNGQILPGSIFDNIVANGPFDLDDAWRAARVAGLENDIRAMPMGMQTMISEGAATFSGGQKQRLMIARAVIRRPRILFLDEATSALDNATQAQVSAALEQMRTTRIVIAHRLSTIVHADRIVVLDGGRIVQEGRYEDLLAAPGLFAALARRQTA